VARYLEMVGTKVRIENASGRKFTVPLTGFSPADQEYVKKAYGRSLFATPQPFQDEGRGGVIVASANGKVEVLVAKTDRYTDPKPRNIIVGESIASGATLTTGSGAEADLLLTNGTLAHLGENTKLVLSALYQKSFKGTKQKASELTKEVSPSRTALKLEEGNLVLEVRKLGKESSFLVETNVAQAGIRGTQFKVSASADSAELSVVEGRVDFLDAEYLVTAVLAGKKISGSQEEALNLKNLSAEEQLLIKNIVDQVKLAVVDIDINRLANSINGPKGPIHILHSASKMELIWCSPGKFIQGNSINQRVVNLSKGFYLGKFEVTQEQYKYLMGNNPSKYKGKNLPVEHVSWNEALEFCKTLNKTENVPNGWEFSLPTEAQWEYACRAGSISVYSWGDSITPQNANYAISGFEKTVNVGTYPPNAWGFYDMHGNVSEWCLDWNSKFSNLPTTDPVGEIFGENKRNRGGYFAHDWAHVGVCCGHSGKSSDRGEGSGFRVALKQVD
jgi:formylglycine-generating enzyme required for sulfatase activity